MLWALVRIECPVSPAETCCTRLQTEYGSISWMLRRAVGQIPQAAFLEEELRGTLRPSNSLGFSDCKRLTEDIPKSCFNGHYLLAPDRPGTYELVSVVLRSQSY
jgi:hypothetical protein